MITYFKRLLYAIFNRSIPGGGIKPPSKTSNKEIPGGGIKPPTGG